MPVYQYRGLNAQGKKVKGLIEAEAEKSALQKLKKQDIYPFEIVETKERAKAKRKFSLPSLERVSASELAVMTRQLATLVGAGLPLVQSLYALSEQVENERLKKTLAELTDLVKEGSGFADALQQFPGVFSSFYVNMVGSGEHSGALDVVLERLADFTEKQSELRNRVLYAMLYPVIILIIGALVVIVMFTYVIPKITVLFEQTKQTLPLITRVMIGLSGFARGYFWLIGLIAIGLSIAFYYWKRTPKGKERWDMFLLKVPVIGEMIRKIAISRFARTLSTLLSSGIPLLKSLEIVEKVVNNSVIEKAISKARENITEGASITGPLKMSKVFPPFVIQMISSGEQSGELEFMLDKAATAFDREVETAINGLTALIEPVMILLLAAIVVVIILSFLLPILQLTQGIA